MQLAQPTALGRRPITVGVARSAFFIDLTRQLAAQLQRPAHDFFHHINRLPHVRQSIRTDCCLDRRGGDRGRHARAAVGSVAGIPANPPDRIVLISAPNDLPSVFEWFAGLLGLRPESRTAFFNRVEEVTGHPLQSFFGTVQLAGLERPALVIHARDDKELSAHNARAFATAGSHVEVLWADGYGHRRILKAPEVIDAVTEFGANGPGPRRLRLDYPT